MSAYRDVPLSLDTLAPHELPESSRVVIHMDDGRQLVGESRTPPGHPDDPLTDEQIEAKFQWCAQALPGERRDRVVEQVRDLESLEDVAQLVSLMAL